MYQILLADASGNVIDAYGPIQPSDVASPAMRTVMMNWIEDAIRLHMKPNSIRPTLALGTGMQNIPLCPCCGQSEGSCSCPAGRDAV